MNRITKRTSLELAIAALAIGLGAPAGALAQSSTSPKQAPLLPPSEPAHKPTSPQRSPEAGPTAIKIKGPAVAENTVSITGKVASIDSAKRSVVVRGADGRMATLVVGPNVANFDTISVGDEVTMRYHEALGLAIAKGGIGTESQIGEIRTKIEADSARPLPGEEPGMAAMDRTTLIANVYQIDRQRGILTLRGTDGVPVEIKVPDKNVLDKIKLDDQVIIGYRQAAVVSIEPGTSTAAAGSSDQDKSATTAAPTR